MGEQNDRETIGDEFGVYSVDPEDQLQPGDTLDGDGDVLDRGFRAPERYQWSTAYADGEETLDTRLRQEERDDTETFDQMDGYGGDSRRVGRIIAPDEGLSPDREARMIAREGRATSWDSPEEAAMHYVDEEELTEVEWEPADERTGEDE